MVWLKRRNVITKGVCKITILESWDEELDNLFLEEMWLCLLELYE
jgi:hypothetical protein